MYLTQAIKRAAQVNARGMSTSCGERVRTWPETLARVQKLAGALRARGIDDGQRVALLSHNSDRYFELFHAIVWAGGVFVPINTRLAPPEIAYWLNDSGTEILCLDDAFAGTLEALEGQLDSVREVIYLGDQDVPAGMTGFEAALADGEAVEDALKGGDDLAGIFYTGGTTGKAKGVMLSHTNLVANNLNCVASFGFKYGMQWLHAAPMFHIADGLEVFGVTMVAGIHVFIPGFTPEATLEAIQSHRITHTLLVPTMINLLVHFPEVESYDMSSIEAIVYGASPMPEPVILRALEVLPHCAFTHAYGQTECAPLVSMTGPEFHVLEWPEAGRYKSAGRPALGVEAKVVDANDAELPPGTVGELCVRGPTIMLGYWNKPEATAEALRGGWMHSGDGAYMDEDGFIYIVDRVKDMIITGGENVYSTEVEAALHQHPAVAEAAVIGIPDDHWGEAVHAVVRLKDGESVAADALIAHCHTLIAGFKCPRSIAFRTEPLPLSGAGKILKTELRAPFWKGQEKRVH